MADDPLDYSHLSSLLRRLLDKWWKEMMDRKLEAAAYTANDIEACGRAIANVTHKLYERTLNANPDAAVGGDQGTGVPPETGGGR